MLVLRGLQVTRIIRKLSGRYRWVLAFLTIARWKAHTSRTNTLLFLASGCWAWIAFGQRITSRALWLWRKWPWTKLEARWSDNLDTSHSLSASVQRCTRQCITKRLTRQRFDSGLTKWKEERTCRGSNVVSKEHIVVTRVPSELVGLWGASPRRNWQDAFICNPKLPNLAWPWGIMLLTRFRGLMPAITDVY